ncbi:2'-5' RNA ligase family protein [Sphingomonas sp. Leaf357]|uniref:2'-5' RNA ligase family protein n=1 Tax=Sphingomonas sp. Leaf357 TaxID=1736350 RepID=UPI000A9BFD6F|nr:2'-5' RNA ligase family protein [Sphingomonas sp. Leaf357]
MFEKRIKAAHRFFFALYPPPILARQTVEAMTPFAEGARMMRPERLHVTLDILNDYAEWPDEIVPALVAAGSTVSAAPFDVTLDTVSGGAHTVALRPRLKNAPLERLHRSIAAARAGLGVDGRYGYDFSPHMTLVYRKGESVSRPVAPISWAAEEFVLVHSLIGPARHEVIARWPLNGVPDAADIGQLALF